MSEAMINLLIFGSATPSSWCFASALFGCLLGLPPGVALHVTGRPDPGQSAAQQGPGRHRQRRSLGALSSFCWSPSFPLTRLHRRHQHRHHRRHRAADRGLYPFIARPVEGAPMEVPDGLLEAAKAMGAKLRKSSPRCQPRGPCRSATVSSSPSSPGTTPPAGRCHREAVVSVMWVFATLPAFRSHRHAGHRGHSGAGSTHPERG